MKCGTPTNNNVRIKKRTRNSNYSPSGDASLESHPLSLLINFFAGKYHQTVEVTVPLCAHCKQNGIPEPNQIDFESRSMTFVGHRSWKDDLENENRPKRVAT